jgi:hypothetical protein
VRDTQAATGGAATRNWPRRIAHRCRRARTTSVRPDTFPGGKRATNRRRGVAGRWAGGGPVDQPPRERPARSRREHRAARQVPRRDAALGDAGKPHRHRDGVRCSMGQLLRTKRHTATGKHSEVFIAAVNRHMPATPAWGNQPRIKDANEVTILMRQLTRSTKNMAKTTCSGPSPVPASCAARRAKPGEELPGMIASRSCTGVACADCAIRRPPKSIAMPRSTLWRSTHPRSRLPEARVAVHGRDKYLTVLACGGVALGSQ